MYNLRRWSAVFVLIGYTLNISMAKPTNEEANEISVYSERSCSMQGGACLKEKDCLPYLRTTVRGLCPEQRHRGIECCYWDPRHKLPTCQSVGGECFDRGYCSEVVHARNVVGCTATQMCCILVN